MLVVDPSAWYECSKFFTSKSDSNFRTIALWTNEILSGNNNCFVIGAFDWSKMRIE